MTRRPEDVFDEFFQRLSPEDRAKYRGRHDLSGLPPALQNQLRGLQEMFSEALRNEKQGVPEHVEHPQFHIDYVDSDIQNAIAFRYDDYSFIGITVPLIYEISDVCLRLSKSDTMGALLRVRPSDEEYNELQAGLFYILTAFIVAHEWTHHVHGHVCQPGAQTIFPNEILDTGGGGRMESQIKELAADGYSAYHVLANLIDSQTRPLLILLKIDAQQTSVQDEVLFSLFVVAVAAYLFVRPAPDLNPIDIYKLTHPPQAARMNFLMQEAIGWCSHNRPDLEAWMKSRFQSLMRATAEATLGKGGAQVWANQNAFLKSEEGAKYIKALADGIEAYRKSL
jgi:hypothetical protein